MFTILPLFVNNFHLRLHSAPFPISKHKKPHARVNYEPKRAVYFWIKIKHSDKFRSLRQQNGTPMRK